MSGIKLCLPNDSQQGIGGGWSFRRNLIKAMEEVGGVRCVESIEEADVCLVAGPTMVTRQTIDTIKSLGKKLIVRLDNVPRNSRNRNTGTSRLKEFSERADEVVWQSCWARDYLNGFINRQGVIIHNSVNEHIFKNNGEANRFEGNPVYLYSRFNRDETKNWEVAWYEYQLIQRENKDAQLILVGQFSQELIEYNFDFFRGEKIHYFGVVEDPQEMARIMRGCNYLLATYYNDCFSNTYLEALMCGVKLVKVNMSGGTVEMLKLWEERGRDYFKLERMGREYKALLEKVL